LTAPLPREPGFPACFEAALARLRFAAESAYAEDDAATEPERLAAALRAVFEFASRNPSAAWLLTGGALAHGPYGNARYQELLGAAAGVLASLRAERPEAASLPAMTECALLGGLATLLARRLQAGAAEELQVLAPEAIEFVLTPYLGALEARRLAGE
jgi:hypothetical protein